MSLSAMRFRHAVAGLLVLLLAACGGLPTEPPRAGMARIKDGISTREEAIGLIGRPDHDLMLPRLLVHASACERCLRWDQRSLRALIYEDAWNDMGMRWLRETQVFIDEAGKVCAHGFWERQMVSDDRAWEYKERDYR